MDLFCLNPYSDGCGVLIDRAIVSYKNKLEIGLNPYSDGCGVLIYSRTKLLRGC